MKTKIGVLLLSLAALAMILTLAGCGGDDPGPATVDDAQLTIHWSERSPVAPASVAPSSALSIEVTLEGAAPDGTDYTEVINRNADPAAYTETYALRGPLTVGRKAMIAWCFAEADGAGDVVGIGAGTVEISWRAAVIGDVSISGTAARCEVLPGQQVQVQHHATLQAAVYDGAGRILAVSPGSIFWSVSAGDDHLRFEDGQAVGVERGEAMVIATVDQNPSAPAGVRVLGHVRALLLGRQRGAPADAQSGASAVSADGKVVVGTGEMGDGTEQAFRWLSDTNMVPLGVLPGFTDSGATAVSADGSIVVGACYRDVGNGESTAFIWTAPTGMQPLLDVPPADTHSAALSISHDGSVVVGWTRTWDGDEAFVWANGVLRVLGDFLPPDGSSFSVAHGVSADGTAVVGEARYDVTGEGLPISEAFRWEATAGKVPLGYLHQETPRSLAYAISADGRVIAGEAGTESGMLNEPCRWTAETGPVGMIAGSIGAGLACSGDGSFIVGVSTAWIDDAICWDLDRGGRHLIGLMAEHGLVLPDNYGPISGSGVSADGRTIVGTAGLAGGPHGIVTAAYLLDLP